MSQELGLAEQALDRAATMLGVGGFVLPTTIGKTLTLQAQIIEELVRRLTLVEQALELRHDEPDSGS